jgi:hypothetical protein
MKRRTRLTVVAVLSPAALIGIIIQAVRTGAQFSNQGLIGLVIFAGVVIAAIGGIYLLWRSSESGARKFRQSYDRIVPRLKAEIVVPAWLFDGADPLQPYAESNDALPTTELIFSSDEQGVKFVASWGDVLAVLPWEAIVRIEKTTSLVSRTSLVDVVAITLRSSQASVIVYPGALRRKSFGWLREPKLSELVRNLEHLRVRHSKDE